MKVDLTNLKIPATMMMMKNNSRFIPRCMQRGCSEVARAR